MPKSIYVKYLVEQPNSNPHYLNRLIKFLNHFIAIEPNDKPSGFECHHIVPKSWKPEWSKEPDNLLKVPAKAHYVIHHLMYKAFPDSISMQQTFWLFSIAKKQQITAKIFQILKLQRGISVSKLQKGRTLSVITKSKISKSMKRYRTFRRIE